MKKTINKIIVLALFLSAGTVGCKKQLDINANPNNPSDDVIEAENILPNAMHFTGAATVLGYGWLANWMGYWSASGSFNPSTEESSYGITNTFQEVKWGNVYNVLFDLHLTETKAKAKGQAYYQAVAMILKAHLYQNLVDIYGNIPYSQAFQPTEFPSPAYDDAKSIYDNLQVKLDEAIGIMKTVTASSANKELDIIYKGVNDSWIKLANTIKLRLLIRQTLLNANPTAEIAKIKANGGVLQTGMTAAVDAGYQNDVNKQSPFFGTYGLLPSGEDANTFFRGNEYSVEGFKSRDDPRIGYFFKKAKSPTNPANPYVGTEYGSEPNTAFGGDQTSNIGLALTKSADQAQWFVTSVESMFLQAEAIQRGWDIGGPFAGNAKGAYQAAVRESFTFLGVTNAVAEANSYMTLNADYDAAADKITLIVREKYYSLTGINPLEAWNDYRRLNVPADIPLSVNSARGSRVIPVRLSYPSAEYAVNATSVQAQGTVNTQTSKLFWDK